MSIFQEAYGIQLASWSAGKYVSKRDPFTLQGNNGSWVDIPATEYVLHYSTGEVAKRDYDEISEAEVNWDAFTSYRASYSLITKTTKAKQSYSNQAQTAGYLGYEFNLADAATGEIEMSAHENLVVQEIYATSGHIAYFGIGEVDEYTISSDTGLFRVRSNIPSIELGSATDFATGVGIWQGKHSGTYKWRAGDPSGSRAEWTGTVFNVVGSITATSGSITGTLTVSGTITNSAAPPRYTLDSAGFKGYDSGGIQRYQLLNDGSGWLGAATTLTWTNAGVVTIGGFTIASSTISVTNFTLDATNKKMTLGSGTDVITLDANDATYRLAIGHSTYASAPFRVTKAGAATASNIDLAGGSVSGTFTVSGTLRSAASPNARYELTSAGLKTYDSGNVQRTQILNDGSGWLGSSSIFSWTTAGVVSLNGSAVVGNSLDADKVTFTAPTISGLTLTNNSPGAGQVAWSSFKLTYQGVSYTVSSGNTANKYIYWKKSVSTTVLQTSATIPAQAADTFIVAINLSGTAHQSNFAPFIYADYISVGQLSAISADMGSITAGTITGGTIRTASSGARTEMHATNLFGLGFGGIGGTDGTTAQWYAKASDGKFYAGGSVIDSDGIALTVGSAYASNASYKFKNSGGTLLSYLSAWDDASFGNYSIWAVQSISAKKSKAELSVVSPSNQDAEIYLHASYDSGNEASLRLKRTSAGVKTITAVSDTFNINSSGKLTIGDALSLDGNITWQAHNTYDIGASGATGPRDLWLGRNADITGNLVVDGNVTLGDATGDTTTVNGTLKTQLTAGAATFALDASGGTGLTLANNAIGDATGNANNFSGLLIINETAVDGAIALFLIGNGIVTLIAQQSGTLFSTTSGTASKINVYLSSSVVKIENKRGGSRTFNILAIRSRAQQ